MPDLTKPQFADARPALPGGGRPPARRLSVDPQVLASCALEGPSPRRRSSLRMLRIVGVLAALALCAAFWAAVSETLLRVLG
jgi:hypothetical protein